ncbi:hypothetical protein ACCO45_013540 [Purpureocillium lilacinum]|uniref:Uncharacterized protein n=1 Tax=Purpureocillium lilacinum TaxID=33203 RepID=A0ACC4D6Y0_PURLI
MKDLPGSLPGKPVLPSLWTENLTLAVLNRLPNRYHVGRRRMRAKSNTARNGMPDITSLETSFSFWDGIRDLQKHKFKPTDLQYLFVAGLTLFMLWIAPPAPTIKFFALVASVWALLPVSHPCSSARAILLADAVQVHPLRLSAAHLGARAARAGKRPLRRQPLQHPLRPQARRARHPGVAAVRHHALWGARRVLLLMFIFAAPGTLPVFARSFGWMSILGVTIQLVFPCTPPWYENEHGLVPAAYGMPGSPAGLARVDEIFGIDLYTTNFTAAPLPFGAFPSLHGGYAVLEALFMSHCFPQFRVFFIAYAGWIWWATMYLSHHYAIDLVGGGLIGMAFYYTARARWLPRRQADKMTRWDYDYVEVGDRHRAADEELGGQYFSLGLLEHRRASSSDGWTLGSSSSYSSSSGTVSPTISEGPPGMLLVDMESNGQLWDGNAAPRDVELSEVVVMR